MSLKLGLTKEMVGAPAASSSLKEYLKKYQDGNEIGNKTKKKKKKVKTTSAGVLVVDEDPVWQKPVTMEEEEDNDSADEEKPLVEEDIEVKRMKRLELLRSRRPFGAIWVSIADTSKGSGSTRQISNLSPPRRKRADTPSPEPELKPSLQPRKHTKQNDSALPEYESKSSRDLSPPRQKQKHYQSSRRQPTHHFSPSAEPRPRKEFSNPVASQFDLSPPRRVRQDDSHGSPTTDLSPPKKGRKDRSVSSDLSSRQASRFLDKSNTALRSSGLDLSPPRKTQKNSSVPNQRTKTGLVTGEDIKQEIAKTKKEDLLRFQEMDPSISGRGAEPVYRDKVTGERISKDQYLKLQKKEEKPKEVKLEWGKGLVQKREAEARLQELESEIDKPFARSRDDPELDKMLKEAVRWGDPMAHLVKNFQNKQTEQLLGDLGDNEKESGFIIPQDIPSHSWIRRGIHAPTNRYGIKPGRHWDGVDRSNGSEKQMFKRTNEKQATEREAYLWSVADM